MYKLTAHSPPAQQGTELSLAHWHICHHISLFPCPYASFWLRKLNLSDLNPWCVIIGTHKSWAGVFAKSCVIYYHNSNPITLHCWWTVWMAACSFIHSHLWSELHNGSSLKFTLHTSEWESSVFDGQLTHLCGIKAIRYKGRQNGTRSEVWARTGCLWLLSPRDVCSGACRSDWLFMHIRSVAERCYFYEGIWVYKDIQSWENAAKWRNTLECIDKWKS